MVKELDNDRSHLKQRILMLLLWPLLQLLLFSPVSPVLPSPLKIVPSVLLAGL